MSEKNQQEKNEQENFEPSIESFRKELSNILNNIIISEKIQKKLWA